MSHHYRARFNFEDAEAGTWTETENFNADNDEAAEHEALERAEMAFQQSGNLHPVSVRIELIDNRTHEPVSTIEAEKDDHSPSIYQHRTFARMRILYEIGEHTVRAEQFGKTHGFAVYLENGTHAVRVASIGYSGNKGLRLAIKEANKRENHTSDDWDVTCP